MTAQSNDVSRQPAIAHVLQFFDSGHLRDELAAVAEPFEVLADKLTSTAKTAGPELTVALRKLLEAKDAAVRHTLTELHDDTKG